MSPDPRVILQTPGMAEKPQGGLEQEAETDDNLLSTDDPLPDLKLEGWQPPKPWDDILEEADGYHYGAGEYIQDNVEALKLYKDAARLGSLVAYEQIGEIYESGDGIRQDLDKALQYWKEGARRGNYFCYALMSSLFFRNGQIENFYKAFKRFLNHRNASLVPEVEVFSGKCYFSISWYLKFCLRNSMEVRFIDDLEPLGKELAQHLKMWILRRQEEPSLGSYPEVIEEDRTLLNWVEKNLCAKIEGAQVPLLTVDHLPLRTPGVNGNVKRPGIFSKWFGRS